MKKSPRFGLLLLSLILTAALGACVSLASDITPPPGYVPPSPQPTTAPVYPMVPPDPQAGAAIFAEKCAPCHGSTGMGDGPQSAALSIPPAALASPEIFRNALPTDWFGLVTSGDLDRMMPPFTSLDDRQRWDVVAYAYTLGSSDAELAQGKQIYAAGCQSCHGETGQASGAADWTDPAVLAKLSNQQLFDAISNGQGNMPAYAEKFSEVERWALSAYVRSLSFARVETGAAYPAPQSATPSAVTTEATSLSQTTATPDVTGTEVVLEPFTIQGKLTLPAGSTLAAGTNLTLEAYDNMQFISSLETVAQADGSFVFENVEALTGRVYLVSLTYGGVPYSSDPIHMTDVVPGQPVTVEIAIEDTTTDASLLTVERMHVFFDFPTDTQTLQVLELYIINNPTGKVVISAGEGQPIVNYELPEGAANLAFQDGELGVRYVQTDTGFGDTEPIPPGSGFQVLFAYELPYTNKLKLDLRIALPVQAAVVMVPEGMKLKNDLLVSSGSTAMQGMNIEVFTAANLAGGSTLTLNLSGRPGTSTTGGTDNNWIAVVIGGLVLLAALGGAGWFILRQRKAPVAVDPYQETLVNETPEDTMDAIIALDDLYQAGKLPKEAYEQRRTELKARLATLKEQK
jgi:mono/diheme cytochrome c family protein